MLDLRPDEPALLYHVGDSRLYELAGKTVTPLTIDHVPATSYAMQGLMTEGEWWEQVHSEHRSQISQAFILGNAFANTALLSDPLYALTPLNLPPFLAHMRDRRPIEIKPGATYLLASDGFWACPDAQLWLQRWPALLHGAVDAEQILTQLFDAIRNNPPPALHPDNITAIALRATQHD